MKTGKQILPSSSFPEVWYDYVDLEHFWIKWRFRVVVEALKLAGLEFNSKQEVLDVGAGNGIVRAQLEALTKWKVDCTELNANTVRNIRPGRGETFRYDILDRQPALAAKYDVVMAFDVLEHIKDTHPFVEALFYHLKPGGLLLLNVPALPILFSDYDRVQSHFRRYTKSSLRRELSFLNSAQVLHISYWGFSLVPIAALRKLWMSFQSQRDPNEIMRRGFEPPKKWLNRLLASLSTVETTLLNSPPAGTSLLLTARKR